MAVIKQATLNVAGLNNVIKSKRIAKCINKMQVDLIFLQETHLRAQEEKYLKNILKGQLFHAPAIPKTNFCTIRL